MKEKIHLEKWATISLGVVSLVLLLNLVRQFSGVNAGTWRPILRSARAQRLAPLHKVSLKSVDEFSHYDPVLRLDVLRDLQARPLPKLDRNPFEFAPTPEEVKKKLEAARAATEPPPPPPPPPVPLKALGYSENNKGKEAYLTDEQEIYVVHEGEEFARRFKAIKITPTQVEIEDESFHRTVQLLIPQ